MSFSVSAIAEAQTAVTLAWDPSPESNVAGYTIYYGTQSGIYPNSLNVGPTTSSQVTGLASGRTYYFVVKAYNTSAVYSGPSNEIAFSTGGTPPTPPTNPAPTITGVTPSTGPLAGGTSITITGTNFVSGAVVRICGSVPTYTQFVHAGAITAQTAPHAAGACAVQVVNPDSQSTTLASGFTYANAPPPPPQTPPPTLASVSPNSGPPIGGTTITLTGANFQAGATVTIGGVAALNPQVINAATIRAVTPAGAVGPRTVVVRNPNGVTAQLANAFSYVATSPDDADGDGMPDAWELQYGLNPRSATGDDGADGDPDGDGVRNVDEYHNGTHPRGFAALTRYFAEGADSAFFQTRFAIMNPQTAPAHVRLEFMDEQGNISSQSLIINPRSRATIQSQDLVAVRYRSFSTKIETDQQIIADRLMVWGDHHYGSSAETSVEHPATTWYLAEGATFQNFDLYYLLENANEEAAQVTIRYLRGPGISPITKKYTVGAHTRLNIHVDDEDPGLAWTPVSAEITVTNDVPIIVERAMYLTNLGQPFIGGHASAAVEAPANDWFLAEGATGSFWSMFILIENPNPNDAQVRMTYMLPGGETVVKDHLVPANTRYDVPVGGGEDPRLENTMMSTHVTSTNGVPIVVERTMWWPAPQTTWYEGHNAFGATSTGTKWGLAEGELGGTDQNNTFVLVANTSPFQGRIRVTLLFEDRPEVSQEFTLDPTSRTNLQFSGSFGVADGKRFSTLVESIGDPRAEIVIERAMYSSLDGKLFSSGSNALGTKLQ